MAIQSLYATALVSGAIGTSANALGAPNGTFTTDADNTSWVARFAMGNPSEAQASGSDHTFTLRVRKEAGTGTPTVTSFAVYSGTTQLYVLTTAISVTSTTGQDVVYSVPIANLAGVDLSTIDVEVAGTTSGGGPSARSTVQLDAITWTGDFTTPVTPPPSTFSGWGLPI
jgi:hypothetical protein